jgi:hypothetical protein
MTLKSKFYNAKDQLAVRQSAPSPHSTGISNAQARVWQLATARATAAAKHMPFCLP